MEDWSEAPHVEVELTSQPAARMRRWRRRGDGAVDPAAGSPAPAPTPEGRGGTIVATTTTSTATGEPQDDGSVVHSGVGPSAGPQRRIVAVGAAAGAVGLALGWLLGGTTGPFDGSAAETPATSDEIGAVTPEATGDSTAESTGDATSDSDDALEPIDTVRPTTTARRTTTTSTLAPPATTEVVLDAALAGADFRIVGIVDNTATAEIDVAAGTMTTQKWGVGALDPYGSVVGDGWVAAGNPSNGQMRVVTSDGVISNAGIGDPWSLLWIEGTELFWRGEDGPPWQGGFNVYEQVDLSGEATGPTIEGRGMWPSGVDPAGGIVTTDQGKTYSLREEGVDFIGEGQPLAVSADHAVLRTCDEQLVCGVFVVDRATGERRQVPVDGDRVPGGQFGLGSIPGEITSDGGAASFFAPTERDVQVVVLDLVTGELRELAPMFGPPVGLAWSPDGRFGVFLDTSTPSLYDRETGEVRALGRDLGRWNSVDVRPPA